MPTMKAAIVETADAPFRIAEIERPVPGPGEVLVRIAGMEKPPKVFAAGSDALAVIMPAIEARLQELHAYEELSKATDRSEIRAE